MRNVIRRNLIIWIPIEFKSRKKVKYHKCICECFCVSTKVEFLSSLKLNFFLFQVNGNCHLKRQLEWCQDLGNKSLPFFNFWSIYREVYCVGIGQSAEPVETRPTNGCIYWLTGYRPLSLSVYSRLLFFSCLELFSFSSSWTGWKLHDGVEHQQQQQPLYIQYWKAATAFHDNRL